MIPKPTEQMTREELIAEVIELRELINDNLDALEAAQAALIEAQALMAPATIHIDMGDKVPPLTLDMARLLTKAKPTH